MNEPIKLTKHVLERYMERTGVKKIDRAIQKVELLLENAIVIRDWKRGVKQLYSKGLIFVVKNGVAITVYPPKTMRQKVDVYNAHSAMRSK